MDKIYMDAKDKNVAVNVVHYNGTDLKVFVDPEHKNQIEAGDLWDLCLKGVIVQIGENAYAIPTAFGKSPAGVVGLTVVVDGTAKVLMSK